MLAVPHALQRLGFHLKKLGIPTLKPGNPQSRVFPPSTFNAQEQWTQSDELVIINNELSQSGVSMVIVERPTCKPRVSTTLFGVVVRRKRSETFN